DARVVVRQSLSFRAAFGYQFPHEGMGKGMRVEFVAAGMAFPFPIGARPIPPAVGIGKLESFAFEGASEEPIGAAKFAQPLESSESLPDVRTRLDAAGGGITKDLAGQVVRTPAPVVIGVDDL